MGLSLLQTNPQPAAMKNARSNKEKTVNVCHPQPYRVTMNLVQGGCWDSNTQNNHPVMWSRRLANVYHPHIYWLIFPEFVRRIE